MFREGEKVIINLPDENERLDYPNPEIIPQMKKFNKKVVTICKRTNRYFDERYNYTIEEDDKNYAWNERWLRSAKKSNIGRWQYE